MSTGNLSRITGGLLSLLKAWTSYHPLVLAYLPGDFPGCTLSVFWSRSLGVFHILRWSLPNAYLVLVLSSIPSHSFRRSQTTEGCSNMLSASWTVYHLSAIVN